MLSSLPDEALVCVFSFIEGKQLITKVSLVCKRFRSIISSEWYWKRRMSFACGAGMDMVDLGHHVNDTIVGIQLSCIETEHVRMACDEKMGFMKLESLSASSGGIDCVQLLFPDMNRTEVIVAAGSRDHIIYMWKKRVKDKSSSRTMREYISTELTGHMGWVWCLASHASNQHILASGSWDQDLRLWDVSHGLCARHFRKVHKGAVLSVTFPEPHLLLTGGYDKKLKLFDLRGKKLEGTEFGSHLKSVLALASERNCVYSCSEDKTVKLWDIRRPNKQVSMLKCPSSVTSICLNHDVLSVASGTTVRLLDVSQGSLEVKDEFEPGHSMALTSVYHNLGMIVTGSKDRCARIHTMTTTSEKTHTCLKTFKHSADVTDVHFKKGILAIGSSDRTASLWLPKNL